MTRPDDINPSVLFVCVHNAGRSQMAAGWLRHLSEGSIDVYSGGSNPVGDLNEVAVAAMEEIGIDITGERPRAWIDAEVRRADVIVSMGCGDTCPVYPGKRYLEWDLTDPAGQSMDVVRAVRDDIEQRVRELMASFDTPEGT
jgi:arsenate reductase